LKKEKLHGTGQKLGYMHCPAGSGKGVNFESDLGGPMVYQAVHPSPEFPKRRIKFREISFLDGDEFELDGYHLHSWNFHPTRAKATGRC
jgi:hypothetical protein